MSEQDHDVIAALAVDYWKLLRSFERLANEMPADRSARLQAQARFSASRLQSHLETCGLQLLTFDGQGINPTLPIVAVNADDLGASEEAVVESTIEPAVVSGSKVILVGRVMASAGAV